MKRFQTLIKECSTFITEDTINTLAPFLQNEYYFKVLNKDHMQYKDLTQKQKDELQEYIKTKTADYNKMINHITPNREYQSWIIGLIKNNIVVLPEDNNKIKETLEQFTTLKRNPNFTKRKITEYKTYGELAKHIDQFTKTSISQVVNIGDNKLIYEKGEYQVVELVDWSESKHLLEPSKWCVKEEDTFILMRRSNKHPFYLVLKDKKQYALIAFLEGQLKDFYDEPFMEISNEFADVIDWLLKNPAKDEQLNFSVDYLCLAKLDRFKHLFDMQSIADGFANTPVSDLVVVKSFLDFNPDLIDMKCSWARKKNFLIFLEYGTLDLWKVLESYGLEKRLTSKDKTDIINTLGSDLVPFDLFEYIINKKYPITTPTNYGFIKICEHGNYKKIKKFIEAGVDVNKVDEDTSKTYDALYAILGAAGWGRNVVGKYVTLELLLKNGAIPQIKHLDPIITMSIENRDEFATLMDMLFRYGLPEITDEDLNLLKARYASNHSKALELLSNYVKYRRTHAKV